MKRLTGKAIYTSDLEKLELTNHENVNKKDSTLQDEEVPQISSGKGELRSSNIVNILYTQELNTLNF